MIVIFEVCLCDSALSITGKQNEYVIAQTSSNVEVKTDNVDDVNELEKSNITTRVYRSNDPALELLDNPANINAATLSDLLSKEELLKGKKSNKEDLPSRNSIMHRRSLRSILFPWFVLFGLVIFLGLIFKFVTQAK